MYGNHYLKGKKWGLITLGMVGMTAIFPVTALENSVTDKGIKATKLHQPPYDLKGRKIAIGQVEIGRPPQFGWDKVASQSSVVDLAGVFFRDRLAEPNTALDTHASMVAMVMVSQHKKLLGVAPEARLYSGAVGQVKGNGQDQECLTSQHIASQNGEDVRAINFSFGESLSDDFREEAKLDGNALLTQCIDWSARIHNTLYVVAGNQGTGGIPIPTDQYNGITTAYSAMREEEYIKVDFANLSRKPEGIGRRLISREINTGNRRAVSLLAPGHQINVYDLEGNLQEVSGTSFAAPHITASVALLQEYGDRQLIEQRPDWSINSRRQELMKAVLLNGADKIADSGDGNFLGMSRTIRSKSNRTWIESDAYHSETIPLDMEMGTGHLNVWRAYQQLSGGNWGPTTPVPPRGWDYNSVKAQNYQEYILKEPLTQDSHVSITLTWNRLVELKDGNENGIYDLGETFRDRGLNNLDLYLMPQNATDHLQSTCASRSINDSVEHIFCPIPQTGYYKIRVVYRRQFNDSVQPYALAWWTKK